MHLLTTVRKERLNSFTHALADFLQRIEQPQHSFSQSLAFIDTWLTFTPSNFSNNGMVNTDTENHGSAKIFALALQLNLSKQQTLLCFGEHYRNLALSPDNSHLNIRRLINEDLAGIAFDNFPLRARSAAT